MNTQVSISFINADSRYDYTASVMNQRINEHGVLVEWHWQGTAKVLGKIAGPSVAMSTRNRTRIDLGSNPVLRDEKVKSRVTYGEYRGTPTSLTR